MPPKMIVIFIFLAFFTICSKAQDCTDSIKLFQKNGGCALIKNKQNPLPAMPLGIPQTCADAAMVNCPTDGNIPGLGDIPTVDCTACIAQFQRDGGCTLIQSGKDASSKIPQNCPQDCKGAALVNCPSGNMPGSPKPSSSVTGGPANCTACASQFKANGGCALMQSGQNPSSKIPQGCQSCEAAAMMICSTPKAIGDMSGTVRHPGCVNCVAQFTANGGCAVLKIGGNLRPYLPENCANFYTLCSSALATGCNFGSGRSAPTPAPSPLVDYSCLHSQVHSLIRSIMYNTYNNYPSALEYIESF